MVFDLGRVDIIRPKLWHPRPQGSGRDEKVKTTLLNEWLGLVGIHVSCCGLQCTVNKIKIILKA